jgi:hypothetical protein
VAEEDQKTIGFRGSEEYRAMIQRAALDRRIKVQQLLEEAVAAYLSGPRPATPSEGEADDVMVAIKSFINKPDKSFAEERILQMFLEIVGVRSTPKRKNGSNDK